MLVKGCKDLFAADILKFNRIVEIVRQKALLYACSEISTPILEHTEIFSRSLGEFSDVVSKEMYSFVDQGNDNLTLRPEFTAAIMRAVFSNGLQNHLPMRLFSYGPLFRRERPQAGRQRQFHQVNIEFLGAKEPYSDAEVIKLGVDILNALEIKNYTLEINSLGCETSRKNYQQVLLEYLNDFRADLSEISKVRLEKNPLRILDSKDENDQKLILNAPKINQYYTEESAQYFAQVLEYLADFNVDYVVNPNIVRGLDYYSHTAFEFVSKDLGAQSTIIAGGRYDGLSAMMGGVTIPAIGFGGGIERMMLLSNQSTQVSRPIVVVPISQAERKVAYQTVDKLRQTDTQCIVDYGKKIGDVLQRAINKYNAKYVIIIGGQEVAQEVYTLRDLDNSVQHVLKLDELLNFIRL
jgi:histidyl-tRNA synthetase